MKSHNRPLTKDSAEMRSYDFSKIEDRVEYMIERLKEERQSHRSALWNLSRRKTLYEVITDYAKEKLKSHDPETAKQVIDYSVRLYLEEHSPEQLKEKFLSDIANDIIEISFDRLFADNARLLRQALPALAIEASHPTQSEEYRQDFLQELKQPYYDRKNNRHYDSGREYLETEIPRIMEKVLGKPTLETMIDVAVTDLASKIAEKRERMPFELVERIERGMLELGKQKDHPNMAMWAENQRKQRNPAGQEVSARGR